MLHVLHVDTGRGWRGGQAQVFGLLRTLRDEPDLRQTLCAPPSARLTDRVSELGIETLALPLRGEWDFSSSRRINSVL